MTLVGMGAVMPEVLAAADLLREEADVEPDVLCVTSADLLFRALRARGGFGDGDPAVLDQLLPAERAAPLVTVLDGHPHALAFLGAVNGVPVTPLGVSQFGQSGDLEDVYRQHGIDAETVVGAALDLLD